MRSKITTEVSQVFELKLTPDEVIHIEAALDAFQNSDDDRSTWLGFYRPRFKGSLVERLHQAFLGLRDDVAV